MKLRNKSSSSFREVFSIKLIREDFLSFFSQGTGFSWSVFLLLLLPIVVIAVFVLGYFFVIQALNWLNYLSAVLLLASSLFLSRGASGMLTSEKKKNKANRCEISLLLGALVFAGFSVVMILELF